MLHITWIQFVRTWIQFVRTQFDSCFSNITQTKNILLIKNNQRSLWQERYTCVLYVIVNYQNDKTKLLFLQSFCHIPNHNESEQWFQSFIHLIQTSVSKHIHLRANMLQAETRCLVSSVGIPFSTWGQTRYFQFFYSLLY